MLKFGYIVVTLAVIVPLTGASEPILYKNIYMSYIVGVIFDAYTPTYRVLSALHC